MQVALRQSLVIASMTGLIFGLSLGFIAGRTHGRASKGYTLRDTDAEYTFVKPLLACDVGATEESDELKGLHAEISRVIQRAIDAEKATRASVYFRDLNQGSWTAVNLDQDFSPASLMKLPVLMAYLKQAEANPELLALTLAVDEDPLPGRAQDIAGSDTVQVGRTYTIEELLRLMIIQSDNRALTLLMNYVDTNVLQETLEDLGVPDPVHTTQSDYTLTSRAYSRFLRILYNGTYLTPELSELALTILSEAEFDDGLKTGIPDNVKITHKFGEASAILADGTAGHELHDCGIVYANRPYLICVMTEGSSTAELSTLIANISRTTYEFQNR